MGSLMAGPLTTGQEEGSAPLLSLTGAGAAAGRVNGQWEAGDPCAPGPGGQGQSALDPWGLWLPLEPGLHLAVGFPRSEN